MIRLVLSREGTLLAVEDDAKRGVVRVGASTRRFADAVGQEFPELQIILHKDKRR